MSHRNSIDTADLDSFTVEGASATADAIVSLLDDYGVALVPRWLDPDTTARLRAEQDYIWAHEVPGVDMDHPAKGGRVVRLRRERVDPNVTPATAAVFGHELMTDVSTKYLRAPFILNREIFVSDHGYDETPILPLHYDQLQCLKFYIYLADTTEPDGAFTAVPGSHRFARALRGHYLSRGMTTRALPNREIPEGLPAPVPIVGEAGTMIVFDTDAYHMGGTVAEGHRRRVMRGHTRKLPMEIHGAPPFTRQWVREHPLNPATAVRRGLDRLFGVQPPSLS